MSITIESGKIRSLGISHLAGKITIKTHDKEEILIETINEDKIEVERDRVSSHLEIKGKFEESETTKGKFSFSNIFGSNVVIGNGNVVSGNNITIVNGKVISGNVVNGELPEVDMTIFVPKNSIKYLDASGIINVDVEGISDQLMVDNSGQTTVKIRNVNKLGIDTSGQSKLEADGVSKLKADISGQSKVEIFGNNFAEVEVDVSGQSNLTIISSSIDELEVDISGQSRLVVHGDIKSKNIYKSGQATFRSM